MRDMLTWMHQNTNDESKEFVNYVAESLHKMTRREQRTTSAYRQLACMNVGILSSKILTLKY